MVASTQFPPAQVSVALHGMPEHTAPMKMGTVSDELGMKWSARRATMQPAP